MRGSSLCFRHSWPRTGLNKSHYFHDQYHSEPHLIPLVKTPTLYAPSCDIYDIFSRKADMVHKVRLNDRSEGMNGCNFVSSVTKVRFLCKRLGGEAYTNKKSVADREA